MLEQILLLFAASLSGGFGGWIFGRRLNKAQAASAEIDNLAKIIAMWEKAAEDSQALYQEMKKQNDEITAAMDAMRLENRSLHNDVKSMTRKIDELKFENKKLTEKINNLNHDNIKQGPCPD